MRILHTSDWHIGKKLKDHDRTEEFRKFFAWLEKIIADENIDALIAAGDIFDGRTPSAESQEIYYSFLAETAGKLCRHVVITAGNHDSPSFIDAPAGIMNRCNIHVVGCACDDPSEEIITLRDSEGRPEIIVCAVPFLRDKDLRTVKYEDTFTEIERQIKTGIMSHYGKIFELARDMRGDNDIPIIAAGHLFLEAGITKSGEGEHSLYVGTAIKVGTDIFPEDIAYVALGHLHSPQEIGRKNIRYSGSPLAMSFGEWGSPKSVSIIDFDGRNFSGMREIEIPVWQEMARISGDMAGIERGIGELAGKNKSVWAEITYTGDENPGDIHKTLEGFVKGSAVEILSVIDEGRYVSIHDDNDVLKGKTLGDIEPMKMLEMIMKNKGTPESTQNRMKELYRKILQEI